MTVDRDGERDRFLRLLVIALAVALFVEFACFNYRHWESLAFKQVDGVQVTLGQGFRDRGDGTVEVVDASTATITLSGFDAVVNNVYLDVDYGLASDMSLSHNVPPLVFMIGAEDGSGDYPPETGKVITFPPVSTSKYLRIHLYRAATSVTLRYTGSAGTVLRVGDIKVNVVYPLDVEPLRVLAIVALIAAVWAFRPSSPLWGRLYANRGRVGRACVAVAVVVSMGAGVVLSKPTPASLDLMSITYYDVAWKFDDNQYDYLARAFMAGRLTLDEDVHEPPFLSSMANPYDTTARTKLAHTTGQWLIPDYAYYGGHVYSYFGPLPALALFVPFRLVTGSDLPTRYAVLFLSVILCVAAWRLCDRLARAYAPRVSVAGFVLGYLALAFGCGLTFLSFTTTTYSVPILSSLICTFFGLSAWLRAKSAEKGGALSKPWLVIGSVLVAANLGCRYSFVLSSLLAIPLFWDEIVTSRRFFAPTREAFANTACVIAPFLVLLAPVLAYNAARFGSAFEFGASYNLTNNDVTARGFVLDRLPSGLFSYLFQPPQVTATFPYLTVASTSTDYLGSVSTEAMYGGLFLLDPILLVLLLAKHLRRGLREHRAWGVVVVSLVLALVLCVLDIESGGVIQRYQFDFAWLLLLASVLCAWQLVADPHAPGVTRAVRTAVLVAVILVVVMNVWYLFEPSRTNNMYWNNQEFYFTVRAWFG